MSDTVKPPLNQGQQEAADGFFQFLFDKTSEIVISGPGGVGKTFWMGHMIDEIMPRYFKTCELMGIKPQFKDVVMTATTNKAAEVLGIATGRPASTIHSYLCLKVQEDFKTGESNLTKTRDWRIQHNSIIFIDEASMIDRKLLEIIRESTCNCKIIYVGDHCQLAPVKETLSPVYNQRLPFFELLEPMRTDIPELQALNTQLRNTVETGVFHPIKVVPGIIDWVTMGDLQTLIDSHFVNQGTNSRILAYTNQRVVDFNDYIRDLRNIQSTYIVGERLINNNAVQLPDGMLSVEQEVEIVALEDHTTMIEIENGVEMEVRLADLKTGYGGVYTEVMLPEDREHYHALIKYYQKTKDWPLYFKLKGKFPDLRQRDAATVHKAQGSSYDTVFIDMNSLSTCHNPDLAARLLYVAASRARHRVVMFGQLADKYGGITH